MGLRSRLRWEWEHTSRLEFVARMLFFLLLALAVASPLVIIFLEWLVR